MTREEREQAFSLRLDGLSWPQIAHELGYTPSNVREDMAAVLTHGVRRPSTPFSALERYIMRQCSGSVPEFARRCQMSYSAVRRFLAQGRVPSGAAVARVLAVTGLDFEEAFGRESQGRG